MKKLMYVLPATALLLASCGGTNPTETEENPPVENEVTTELEEFDAEVVSFADGEATNGYDYFFGVLAEVIEVDVKFNEVEALDDIDAEVERFHAVIDSGLVLIKNARVALDLYKDKNWPKRQELHDLTIEWFDAMEGLFTNHLKGLAESMAKPDEDWTSAETKKYDKYLEALEDYYEVDTRWVEFQNVYAAANDFELSDEGIDVEALVEEDMEKSEGH